MVALSKNASMSKCFAFPVLQRRRDPADLTEAASLSGQENLFVNTSSLKINLAYWNLKYPKYYRRILILEIICENFQ